MIEEKKKKKWYKKGPFIFFLVLLIIQIVVLSLVYNSLLFYEKNELDNYMGNVVILLKKSIDNGSLNNYTKLTKKISSYETTNSIIDGYKEYIQNKKIEFKETKKRNTFDILADDNILFTVKLNDSKKTTRLSLLTITEWELEEIENYSKDGLYHYDIYVPSNYTVKVNDIDILESDKVESLKVEGFEEAYDYLDLIYNNHYEIKNFTKKPTIKIYDQNNQEVEYKIDNNTIKIENAIKIENYEEAKNIINEFDPLRVAEIWSLLVTNDTSLSELEPYLIKESMMYKKAYEWVSGRDRTFTADHYLQTPPFTDEYTKNYTFYNDYMFSVEVHLKKTLFLTRTSSKKILPTDEIFYFVKENGTYKLIDMMSISE